MRFTIKEDQYLNTDVIREEFLERYYPEMETKEMRFVNIFSPITDYVRLQKNLSVTAFFRVKQDPDNSATHIYVSEGVTKRSALLGADFWNFLIRGDFYDDLNRKFNEWLMKKYDLTKDQITLTNPWSRTGLVISSLLWAALIVAVLVFLFDQVHQSVNLVLGHDFTPWQEFLYNLPTGRRFSDTPIILLMFAAFFGIIYYFKKRRKEEREEKMEYFTGMKILPYQPVWSKKKVTVVVLHSALIISFLSLFIFTGDYMFHASLFVFAGLLVSAIFVDFLFIGMWLRKFEKKTTTIMAYLNFAFIAFLAGLILLCVLAELTGNYDRYNRIFEILSAINIILFLISALADIVYYIIWRVRQKNN